MTDHISDPREFPMKKILLTITFVSAMGIASFAQCASLPCVVATASFTKQTHEIPTTTLLTPTTDGTFRISTYLSTSKRANNPDDHGEWEVIYNWSDGRRASRWVVATAGNPGTSAGVGTIVLRDVAGQPLEYRTDIVAGNTGGIEYDVYIVVEQLQ